MKRNWLLVASIVLSTIAIVLLLLLAVPILMPNRDTVTQKTAEETLVGYIVYTPNS